MTTFPGLSYARLVRISDQKWRELAACRDEDPELFFPAPRPAGRGRKVRQAIKQIAIRTSKAKAICAACPVRHDCLAHAVVNGERDGIWGGLTEEERPQKRPA